MVFDDFKLKYLPQHKAWVGCGGEFECSDKYRAKKTLKWVGKCCIILCNTGSGWDWRKSDEWADDVEWFEGNVRVVEIHSALYRE